MSTSVAKPRLLVISAVMPFPRNRGQQVRVYNKLLAFRADFHVTFLGLATAAERPTAERELSALVDQAILLPRLTQRNRAAALWHKLAGGLYALTTGLRSSNYQLGEVEFTPSRVAQAVQPDRYDLIVYEYWHTHATASLFQTVGARCVLDMHDLLFRPNALLLHEHLPRWRTLFRARRAAAYQRREEAAWRAYDALIAINRDEEEYVRQRLPDKPIFYAPMGVDLAAWPYAYCGAEATGEPPRLGFYGALGNYGNQRAVGRIVEQLMPPIWETHPDTELWLIGSRPSEAMRALAAQDPRIHVTGFVDDPAPLIGRLRAVFCPWEGRFGFRSRLIELMAVGAPVIATPDAVHGMGLRAGEGLLLGADDAALAAHARRLLSDPALALQQSRAARRQAELFSFDATYGQLSRDLLAYVVAHRSPLAA